MAFTITLSNSVSSLSPSTYQKSKIIKNQKPKTYLVRGKSQISSIFLVNRAERERELGRERESGGGRFVANGKCVYIEILEALTGKKCRLRV